MNMELINKTAEYAAAVRQALSDLPAEEVEDLTEGLEADLAESWDESDGKPTIEAHAYANELRIAAGLPAAGKPAGFFERQQKSTQERIAAWASSIRKNPAGAWLLDFLVSLRPAWWVLRGYLAFWLIVEAWVVAPLVPTSIVPLLILIACVGGSVWLGAGTQKPFLRWLTIAGNVLAAFVFLLVLTEAAQSGDTVYYESDAETVEGLALNGHEVTNIFAYDANGALIHQVQLFDQDGKPLVTSVPGGNGCLTWVLDPVNANFNEECDTPGVWLPQTLETGAPAWNIFPMQMAESEYEGDREAKPGAVAMDVKPPFVKVPALTPVASGDSADSDQGTKPGNKDEKNTKESEVKSE